MEDCLVLININSYQGGGETLLIRFAKFLKQKKSVFYVVCKENSFIEKELMQIGFSPEHLINLKDDANLYYLTGNERLKLIDTIKNRIHTNNRILRLISFTLKDLYIANEIAPMFHSVSINHLILHVEDYLYLGQSLLDKFKYKIVNKRYFSRVEIISNNIKLLNSINSRNGLISMAEIINETWSLDLNINISKENVIPLPSFSINQLDKKYENNKKIIWVGRIVDFKIPSLLNMIDFISKSDNYTLTIVGDGNLNRIKGYIKKNLIDESKFNFVGEIKYENLKEVINQHSIGYAMGTSLIELAQQKIPVIIALASYSHKEFKSQICGGLFYNQPKGCDGSETIRQKDLTKYKLIEDIIEEIEYDYKSCSIKCYNYAKDNFSIKKNFYDYLKIIKSTGLIPHDYKLNIKTSNIIRKKIHEFTNKI